MIRDKEVVTQKLNDFIHSGNKSCLVLGTNIQKKHKNIIGYLNSLDKHLKILIRINSMQESESILGFKAKTGSIIRVKKLSIQVDSMQSRSQDNTYRNFNCILVYPIGSLKGMEDDNIIDILNYRNAEKIFWISNYDSEDYLYLINLCNIKDIIEINTDDDVIHKRILENNQYIENKTFDKLLINGLSYYDVERGIDEKYSLGGISTSSMGQELVVGSFDKYIFGGSKKTKSFYIKVLEEKENGKYVLIIKQHK